MAGRRRRSSIFSILTSIGASASIACAGSPEASGSGLSALTLAPPDRGAPALPTQFQILSIDAGASIAGAQGQGFTTPGAAGFYRNPSFNPANVLSPAAPSLTINAGEFHSYFSLDALGPSVPAEPGAQDTRDFYTDYPPSAYQALNSTTSPFLIADAQSAFLDPDAQQGTPATAQCIIQVEPQPVLLGGQAPTTGGGRAELQGLFLARLTVASGASIDGGVRLECEGEEPLMPQAVDLALDDALIPATVQTDQGPAQVSFGLRSFLVASPMIDGFGAADVYDVWIVACNLPVIVLQPANQISQEQGQVTFSVVADGPSLTYQWRRAGMDLVDGPGINGSTTPDLDVSDVRFDDALRYDVVISAPCGSTISQGALLTVEPLPCRGDSNTDGSIDFSDITTVLAEWLKQCK